MLIALVVLSLTTVALLGAFATSLSASSEHRGLATIDTVLKSYVEAAIYQLQTQPSPGFNTSCPNAGYYDSLVHPPPTSPPIGGTYSTHITAVAFWSPTGFQASCTSPATGPQMLTAEAKFTSSGQGLNYDETLQFVVTDPSTVAPGVVCPPSCSGSATAGAQFDFPVTATGGPSPTLTATGFPAGVMMVNHGGGSWTVSASAGTVTTAGSYTGSITAQSDAGTSSPQPFTITITAGAAKKLAFTTTVSGNQTVNSAATVGPFVVQVQDQYGNPVTNTGSAVTVNLSTTSGGTSGHSPFFTTVSGGASAGSVTIATNASSTSNFYYSDTKAGTPTVSASATVNSQAVNGSTSGFTMVAGTAKKFVFTSTVSGNQPESSTATVGPFVVQAQDQFGNPVTNTGTAVSLLLSTTSTGTTGHLPFFTTVSGGSSAGAVTIAANASSSSNFYYSDTAAGSPTISASATFNLQVINGSTSGFTMVAAPAGIELTSITQNTTPAVSCTGVVGAITCSSTSEASGSGNVLTAKFVLVDSSGNPINAPSNVTIDLSVPGSGTGSKGTVSPSGQSALTILSGQQTTSASFTLTRDTGTNKTVTLTATVHGTSQTLTVTLSS